MLHKLKNNQQKNKSLCLLSNYQEKLGGEVWTFPMLSYIGTQKLI